MLDLRILNLDRNVCNILVKEEQFSETSDLSTAAHDDDEKTGKASAQERKHKYTLVPIDHGLTLPESLEVCSYDLAWLSFDQAYEPFSQKTLDYIASIDIDEDIAILEQSFRFRPVCLRNMRISSLLLKYGARKGLNLAEIGSILCRPDEDDA